MTLDLLVRALPELYQPIFGHPELSVGASRDSQDRLAQIAGVYKALEARLGRRLRVLDLGCAQGFFSHSLAAMGAEVRGIDALDANIAVCRAIAQENLGGVASFDVALVEEIVPKLELDSYDLVLGLSVFHHLCHQRGSDFVRDLLAQIATKVRAGIFEMARVDEPLYWAPSQPSDPTALLAGFAFVREVSTHSTHLSSVRRPLIFASNQYWYFAGEAREFLRWTEVSNRLAPDVHQRTRRFYFGGDALAKQFLLTTPALAESNASEWLNEVKFLADPPSGFGAPQLFAHGRSATEAWLVRGLKPGEPLDVILAEGRGYDVDCIARDILRQLSQLEEAGLYHSDLRTWNVLVDATGGAHLIDYGAISASSRDCVPPSDVYLAFLIFLRELADGWQQSDPSTRPLWLDPSALPKSFRRAAWSLLASAPSARSFASFLANIDQPAGHRERDNGVEPFLPDLVEQIEQVTKHWQRYIDLLQNALTLANATLELRQNQLHAAKVEAAHDVEAVRIEARALEQQLIVLKEALSTVDLRIARMEGDIADKSAQIASYTDELRKTSTLLEEREAEIARDQETILRQAAELFELQAKCELIAAERMKVEARLESAELTRDEVARTSSLLDVALTEERRARHQLDGALSQSQQKVHDLESQRNTHEAQLQALGEMLTQTSGEVETLRRGAERLVSAEASLEAERFARSQSEHEVDALRGALERSERRVEDLHGSSSWRLTAPLRGVSRGVRWVASGTKSWVLMKPGVRPRRIARAIATTASRFVIRHPRLRAALRPFLNRVPALKRRLVAALASAPDGLVTPQRSAIPHLASEPHSTPNNCTRYLYVDHTVGCAVNSGVQRVVRGVASGLTAIAASVKYVKWDPSHDACVFITLKERERLAAWNGPQLSEEERDFYDTRGEVVVSPSKGEWLIVPEVTHLTAREFPVTLDILRWARWSGLRSGFVFYDAIPLKRAEYSSIAEFHEQYMSAIRLADAVWPISDWVNADLRAFWREHELAQPSTMPRVQTIQLPGASFEKPRVLQGEACENLVLCVGSIEPRKNQVTLIEAFEEYLRHNPSSDWRLVLAGNLHPSVSQRVQESLSPSIAYVGPVSDEELEALYRNCAFTVFPSVEEGFGLPILESVWHGKPCICANFGAMKEVATGGGCLMTDVSSRTELYGALKTVIEDEELRAALAAEAMTRSMSDWRDYATVLHHAIEASLPSSLVVYYWIDGTRGYPSNTGIQRVTRMLAKHLIDAGARLVPVVWGGEDLVWRYANDEDREHLAKWNGPAPESWAVWVDPKEAPVGSVFIMPELPLNLSGGHQALIREHAQKHGIRSASIFYDAIPWKLSHIYPGAYGDAHKQYMLTLAHYDTVVAISEYARSDFARLVSEFGGEAKRVTAVNLAAEFAGSKRGAKSFGEASPSVNVLVVGTVEPRKNHELLIRAFARAQATCTNELQLTIVGREDTLDPGLAGRVRQAVQKLPGARWIVAADDRELTALYEAADFTVFPSTEEGFGLPILESLWTGTPCICANFGAMAEVADGGGCFPVDVTDEEALASAISELADDAELRRTLSAAAAVRRFRSWTDYVNEIWPLVIGTQNHPHVEEARLTRLAIPSKRPLLSVCITTYNRAGWLGAALKNLERVWPISDDDVEILVCDNASTDNTPDVVAPYLARADFRYIRNPKNVGMLGNLRETALASRGKYVWVVGDDDVLVPGAIEYVLRSIREMPGVALCYLNYSFTRIADSGAVRDFDAFIDEATPIVPPTCDQIGSVRDICVKNENFFTAIYTLVFRRDHALLAYSQDITGRPFSSMLTCIPTTHYVLRNMMDESAVWVGSPQVVVNMNVSWMRYAPLWILERIPEVYETAEAQGVARPEMDRWRRHSLPSVVHFFKEILKSDQERNAEFFSPARLVRRFKHLPEFRSACEEELAELYCEAFLDGVGAAREHPSLVFEGVASVSEILMKAADQRVTA